MRGRGRGGVRREEERGERGVGWDGEGHLSVRVGDGSRRCEEIVKNLE